MRDAPSIVVVDDEPKICRLLESLLEREGYEVRSCTDGAAAVKEVVRRRPDLLVTDLMMPVMDGLEVARRVHMLDPDLPVVLITGYASTETAVEALREGISDYITKPFSVAELRGVIGRILENRNLARENRRLVEELRLANGELSRHQQRLTVRVKAVEDDLEVANRELTRRLAEVEVIHEISQMTSSVVEVPELLRLATRLVLRKVGVDAVAVFLHQPEQGEFLVHGTTTTGSELPPGLRVRKEGIAERVIDEGRLLLLPSVRGDERVSRREREILGEGTLFAAPIQGMARPSGVLFLARTDPKHPLGENEARLAELIANDLSIALENARLFEENEQSYIEILAALVNSMEARDPYVRRHSERVRGRSRDLALALNLSEWERDVLETGARLHDLGKVGIPDRILLKPGPLTAQEMDIMRSHPVIGDRIVKPLGRLSEVKQIIRNHHEQYDGGGYPDGLSADDLAIGVQIVTVTDAFDALTSERPYRHALGPEEALAVLQAGAGSQFNPLLVEVFSALERERWSQAVEVPEKVREST